MSSDTWRDKITAELADVRVQLAALRAREDESTAAFKLRIDVHGQRLDDHATRLDRLEGLA